jgi:hypothetical protein
VVLQAFECIERLCRVAEYATVLGDEGDAAGDQWAQPVRLARQRCRIRVDRQEVVDGACFAGESLLDGLSLARAHLPGQQQRGDQERNGGGRDGAEEDLGAETGLREQSC